MKYDYFLAPGRIEVEVEKGTVTIDGYVHDEEEA
jgi:hypothetical protein